MLASYNYFFLKYIAFSAYLQIWIQNNIFLLRKNKGNFVLIIQPKLEIQWGVEWASQVVLVVKALPVNGRHKRQGLISALGRSPGGGHGNPLQCSCPESPMDRGAWRATVHSVSKSQTRLKWLCMHEHRERRRGLSTGTSPRDGRSCRAGSGDGCHVRMQSLYF